ncbi:MAG: ArnT family glycosyltransferase, partial [Candidatus Aminicenantaceae bacterium]
MRNLFEYIKGSRKRLILVLFIVSLLVRMLILIPVNGGDTRIKFDERSYYFRANSFHSIIKDLINLDSPKPKDLRRAYGAGAWPPFHPIILAVGFLFMGKSIVAARITVVVISALSTILIFLVTDKIATKKTALIASFVYIFYPGFIAFSHYLWAETTFIFLLLLGIYLTLLITETDIYKRKVLYSFSIGVILGLLVLSRASGIVFLIVIPLWIVFSFKKMKERIIIFLIIIISFSVVVLPWEYVLISKQNKFVLFASQSTRGLYLGNNKWVRDGFSYEYVKPHPQIGSSLREYAKEHNIPIEKAARELAMKEITSHFGKFMKRSFDRFSLLWTFNFFPIRHITHVVYPPVSSGLLLFILAVFIVSHLLLVVFTVIGFVVKKIQLKNKILIFMLLLAGIAPYLLSISHSRYNLPQLAFLVPLAGCGIANYRPRKIWHNLIIFFTIFCISGIYVYSYNNFIFKILRPSSYYMEVINPVDKIFKTESKYGDVFQIKQIDTSSNDILIIRILNKKGYSFYREKKRLKKRIV